MLTILDEVAKSRSSCPAIAQEGELKPIEAIAAVERRVAGYVRLLEAVQEVVAATAIQFVETIAPAKRVVPTAATKDVIARIADDDIVEPAARNAVDSSRTEIVQPLEIPNRGAERKLIHRWVGNVDGYGQSASAAAAHIDSEKVVAASAIQDVIAAEGHGVVPGASIHRVGSLTAVKNVVSVAAVDNVVAEPAMQLVRIDAAMSVSLKPVPKMVLAQC